MFCLFFLKGFFTLLNGLFFLICQYVTLLAVPIAALVFSYCVTVNGVFGINTLLFSDDVFLFSPGFLPMIFCDGSEVFMVLIGSRFIIFFVSCFSPGCSLMVFFLRMRIRNVFFECDDSSFFFLLCVFWRFFCLEWKTIFDVQWAVDHHFFFSPCF